MMIEIGENLASLLSTIVLFVFFGFAIWRGSK